LLTSGALRRRLRLRKGLVGRRSERASSFESSAGWEEVGDFFQRFQALRLLRTKEAETFGYVLISKIQNKL